MLWMFPIYTPFVPYAIRYRAASYCTVQLASACTIHCTTCTSHANTWSWCLPIVHVHRTLLSTLGVSTSLCCSRCTCITDTVATDVADQRNARTQLGQAVRSVSHAFALLSYQLWKWEHTWPHHSCHPTLWSLDSRNKRQWSIPR